MFSICVVSLWLARSASDPCPDCDGTGKATCVQCEGGGKFITTCPDCAGEAVKSCTRCGGTGLRLCGACEGRGYTLVVEAGIGGGTRRRPCRRYVNCGACRGERSTACKKCGGTGGVSSQCPGCKGTGKSECPRCEGTGQLARQEVPEAPGDAMQAAEQRNRLKQATGALLEASSKIEGLRAKLDELSSRCEAANDSVRALPQGSSAPVPLRAALRDCRDKWADCSETYDDCREALKKLAGLRDAAPEQEEQLRAAIGKLEAGGLAKPLAIGPSMPGEEFASELAVSVQLVGVRLNRLSVQLKTFEKALGELREAEGAHAEKTARERKDAEEKEKTFSRLQAAATMIAEASGLAGATARPLDSSSVLSMSLEIECFDPETSLPDGAQDATPSDEILAKLPRLVSTVFDRCPEVSRVRIRIDAEGLTDTGLPARRTIQVFIMEQPRWRELMTGKYRDDWRTVLSKSKPAPEYPRDWRSSWDIPWVIVAIAAICILGLSVIYVARMRMLQRF